MKKGSINRRSKKKICLSRPRTGISSIRTTTTNSSPLDLKQFESGNKQAPYHRSLVIQRKLTEKVATPSKNSQNRPPQTSSLPKSGRVTKKRTNIDCPTSGKRPFTCLGTIPSRKIILSTQLLAATAAKPQRSGRKCSEEKYTYSICGVLKVFKWFWPTLTTN